MRKSRWASAEPTGRKTDPDRIVEAAIACIERFGVAKTGMGDVAKAAGIGRQTLYRAFPTRTRLLEAIMSQRLSVLALRLKRIVSAYKTFDEALIFGSIESVEASRHDPIYLAVVDETTHLSVERYLVSPQSPVLEFMLFIWRDVLEAARRKHELRSDLSDTQVLNWLRAVHLSIFLRDDLKPQAVAELMRDFVLPALVPDAAQTAKALRQRARSRR